MKNERNQSGDIAVNSPALRWLDNFWYHNKWLVIGVAVAVLILGVCIFQTCTKEEDDTVVVLAGPTYLSDTEREQISLLLEAVMPYDRNGDGEKGATVSAYEIYSEEQIKELEGGEDQTLQVDRSRNRAQYQNYTSYQQTGNSSIYFLDPWLYESLKKEYLCPLETSVGALPEGALADGYGVRLGDTAIYEEYAVLRLLPEDTVVCLMSPLIWGNTSKEEIYQFEKDFFRAIVTFEDGEAVAES